MKTSCDIPVGVRYNNRYRGPHESRKQDAMITQIKYNLSKLKTRVEELEIYKENITIKPDYTNSILLSNIEYLESRLKEIREVVKYEQRNNK